MVVGEVVDEFGKLVEQYLNLDLKFSDELFGGK